jgi:oligoribonuclease NrnB/cAMP/cGMP phosphodiesterase (DHH superfamily)
MTKPLCIYHGNCADGFGAAWVVRRALGDVDFHAGVYQEPPPDVTNRDVLLVDFSYKRPVLEEMADKANSILVLDHHKTAADDLAFLDPAGRSWSGHLTNAYQDRCEGITRSLYALFDMDRSGAGIAWDYFFPNETRPQLINHIEDRDLWRFSIPRTREIQANVFSYPYDFDVWDMLMRARPEDIAKEGEAIERKHFKDIEELVTVFKHRRKIGGYEVPVSNLPYTLTSDAGHLMAKGEPFAACYWDTPEGRVYSLRSTDEGVDVSEIAKGYGGGGHRNASGFRVPYEHELAGAPK